jgi:mono/diheme cytochrome c family protein
MKPWCPRTGMVAGTIVLTGMVLLLPGGGGIWLAAGPLQASSSESPAATSLPLTERKQAARALYERRCQSCHEEDGTGSLLRARVPQTPDFTNDRWQAMRSDPELIVSILEGKGARMPGFRSRLSEEQAQTIVELAIRSFAPHRELRGAARAGDFGRQFHQLEQELANLQRQFRDLSETAKQP